MRSCSRPHMVQNSSTMPTLLGLFLFSLLLTTGASLDCEVCSDLSSSCKGNLTTCRADQDACSVFLSEVFSGGRGVGQAIQKTCSSWHTCKSGQVHVNLGQGKAMRNSNYCCVGTACKAVTPSLPPVTSSKMNGRQCPACYAFTNSCSPGVAHCTGSEDYCIDVVIRVIHEPLVDTRVKGCSTEAVCVDLRMNKTVFGGAGADVLTVECKPARKPANKSPLLSSGSLFRALFGLYLVKVLL